MSVETEVKAVAEDVKADIEKVSAEVEADLDKVTPEAKAEVEKAEAAIAKVEKAARIDVTVAEKLTVRELELEFIKIQMDLRTLSEKALAVQKNFQQTIEVLKKRYAADGDYVWHELGAFFQRIEKKL
jgi:hypothetical protein